LFGLKLSGLFNLFPEPDYEHNPDDKPDQLAYPAERTPVSASPAHHVSVVIHHWFIVTLNYYEVEVPTSLILFILSILMLFGWIADIKRK